MRERIASAALVALVHAGLLFLLLSGGPRVARPASETALSTFDVAPPPPPPPSRDERVRSPARAPRVAGAAGRQARRTPVVAPMPPVAPRPPPPVAAVLPDEGAAPLAGTAASGGGTGAAIGGWGHGAGGSGSGDGGRRARLLSGRIEDRDYPAEARRTRAEGIATVRFTVDTDGHARRCRVQRSAGDAALDAATCRLIEERFRYAPAQDAAGRAVAEERAWQQRWWLER